MKLMFCILDNIVSHYLTASTDRWPSHATAKAFLSKVCQPMTKKTSKKVLER